jgi:hypothetical protein
MFIKNFWTSTLCKNYVSFFTVVDDAGEAEEEGGVEG